MPPPKKTRLDTNNLQDAIEQAGLTQKAVANNSSNLSRLDPKERVSVIGFLGSPVDETDPYKSLSTTASALRGSSFQEMKTLSTPTGSSAPFPVVGTYGLYVREAYEKLYNQIILKFRDSPSKRTTSKEIVVTGTAGIGKSAFLAYFTIRLLATAGDNDPPIVIFQEKGSSECYVYGGLSTLRCGDIKVFEPFLNLPETWYLVDSSPNPKLGRARTIISASPKTLYAEKNFKDVDKEVAWRYYMAPWKLEELEQCRIGVEGFNVVSKDLLEELFRMIGGVPRYVLKRPMKVLEICPNDTTHAKKSAFERVGLAIDFVKDPQMMMQCLAQGKESLQHSSRLLHRWPTDDHSDFCLEWASVYIADKIGESMQDVTWQQILNRLTGVDVGTAKGPMFELYVRHIFRKGGYEFRIKDLQDGTETTIEVPPNPSVVVFDEIPEVPPPGTLCIPTICNHACIDLLLSPGHLFQVTVSKKHAIKGPPFSNLLENLKGKKWISSSEDACLVFVVPSEIYDNFQEQKIPKVIQSVKQFVLKIDLKSASTGKPPGIRGPAF